MAKNRIFFMLAYINKCLGISLYTLRCTDYNVLLCVYTTYSSKILRKLLFHQVAKCNYIKLNV